MGRPVVVFQGENEFEAQMARDVLQSAMIPVLHVPSLSTGILGVRHTVYVAVPEEHVEAALEALEEAGLPGKAARPRQTLMMLSAAQVSRVYELRWILILVALVLAVAVAASLFLRKP